MVALSRETDRLCDQDAEKKPAMTVIKGQPSQLQILELLIIFLQAFSFGVEGIAQLYKFFVDRVDCDNDPVRLDLALG